MMKFDVITDVLAVLPFYFEFLLLLALRLVYPSFYLSTNLNQSYRGRADLYNNSIEHREQLKSMRHFSYLV